MFGSAEKQRREKLPQKKRPERNSKGNSEENSKTVPFRIIYPRIFRGPFRRKRRTCSRSPGKETNENIMNVRRPGGGEGRGRGWGGGGAGTKENCESRGWFQRHSVGAEGRAGIVKFVLGSTTGVFLYHTATAPTPHDTAPTLHHTGHISLGAKAQVPLGIHVNDETFLIFPLKAVGVFTGRVKPRGPGRGGSCKRVTRPDLREFENLLTRPYPTRPDPTGPDRTRKISKDSWPEPRIRP